MGENAKDYSNEYWDSNPRVSTYMRIGGRETQKVKKPRHCKLSSLPRSLWLESRMCDLGQRSLVLELTKDGFGTILTAQWLETHKFSWATGGEVLSQVQKSFPVQSLLFRIE